MDLQKYKAVVFDWDGTLVDTCGLILDAHNHVRVHMGHDLWTMDDFLGQASKSAREYYPEIYGERADEAQEVLYNFVGEHHLSYLSPMQSAQELLSALSPCHFLAVVSNKRHDVLMREIAHVGWQHHFKSMVGAGVAAKDKPSPEPLLHALKEISSDILPEQILYVGDTETDLLCTLQAGCDCVFIQSDRPRPDLVEKYNPVLSCDSVEEFLARIVPKGDILANKAC